MSNRIRSVIVGFSLILTGSVSIPAFAEVEIISPADNTNIEVKADKSSIGEIAIKVTEHYDMELSGEIDSDAVITVDLTGNLKEVLTKILGKNNFLLEYTGEKPTRLVVLGVDPNPPGLVTTATASAIPVEPTPQATQPESQASSSDDEGRSAVPTAEYNRQLVAVSRLQAQQFGAGQESQNNLDPNKSVVDENGNLRPDAAKALTQSSAKQLQELVKALKQLCPTGQTC